MPLPDPVNDTTATPPHIGVAALIVETLTVVAPETLRPTLRRSARAAEKSTSTLSLPPPAKFPPTTSLSPAAPSARLSAPFRLKVAAASSASVCVPSTVTDAPDPISTLCQSDSRSATRAPETFLNESLPFPPPSRRVTSAKPAPSKISSRDVEASAISPLSRVPPVTVMRSQFSSPVVRSPALSDPEPPANVSASSPVPPSSRSTRSKPPLAKVTLSSPPPREISPTTRAPEATSTVAAPAPSRIA